MAAAAFVEVTGHQPEGVWAAPGRVNLIGDHTDYNAGLALPFAIEARSDVAASLRDDRLVQVSSRQRPGELVAADLRSLSQDAHLGWPAYLLGVLWVLLDEGHDLRGVDLVVDGRVPVGSGLSSSASLECAVALAVNDLHDLGLTLEELARISQRAENDFVGAPTGPLDQRASMLCTAGHALLLDTADLSTRQVPLDPAADELALLVVDTRVHHSHANGAYGDRRRACEAACVVLGVPSLRSVTPDDLGRTTRGFTDELRRRVRHVVTESARTQAAADALSRRNWVELGMLMTESHASLRDDYEVSCPELDVVVDTGLESGALGARMTGGGFGGAAIMLVPNAVTEGVVTGVAEAYAARGFGEPAPITVTPAPGARRIA